MIVTVTLNPSLDHTLEIDRLQRGRVNRAHTVHLEPGGKGVNVSRALAAAGVPTRAILPCGGIEGGRLLELLREENFTPWDVPIAQRTRSNVTIVEPNGEVTKINESGPALSAGEFRAVRDAVGRWLPTADWIVVCGAAPPGVSAEDFAALCGDVVTSGTRLAVDTSGPLLRTAAEAGATLVKPNRHELAEVVGAELSSIADFVEAARTLREWGAHRVLASLGVEGALLVDAHGVRSGTPPGVTVRSTVGAGDAMLAGFLAAPGHADPLVEALAWGSAAAGLPSSRMPTPHDLDRNGVNIRSGPRIST